MPDLRVGIVTRLRGRSYGHLTPAYLYYRARLFITSTRYPTLPSLTLDSIRLLERLLRASHVGAEWGAGNSTGWFAERTAHLTSFESGPDYYAVVRDNLASRGLTNVDLQFVPFEPVPSEQANHEHEWMQRAYALADGSLDYALIDSAPRACLCRTVVSKLRSGGLLILDNANWYLPPPADLRPAPVGSITVPAGFPGSRDPGNVCTPAFLGDTAQWQRTWTSDGVTATLILFKP